MSNPQALITGSAKKIGRALAIYLAQQGWNIIIHYHCSVDEANILADEIRTFGVICELRKADLSNEIEVKKLASDLDINLLINNASSFINDKYSTCNFGNLEAHTKINVGAPILLSRIFFEHLKEKEKLGNIINILDYSIAKFPNNFFSYTLSKRALWDCTKLLAYEMASLIRVNAIALGHIVKNEKQSIDNFEHAKATSPLKIRPTLEELCQTVDFILKTSSLTGQVIFLDSGKHLQIPESL